jgi:hypothetical protein
MPKPKYSVEFDFKELLDLDSALYYLYRNEREMLELIIKTGDVANLVSTYTESLGKLEALFAKLQFVKFGEGFISTTLGEVYEKNDAK